MQYDPLDEIRRRLKAIEDAIWPPGPPGQPTIFETQLEELEKKLGNLQGNLGDLQGNVVTKEIIDDLINVIKMLAIQRRPRENTRTMTMEN